MSFSISFISSLRGRVQSRTKWPTFSQLKHLASIEFGVAALTNGFGMAEVVYAKVLAEARFRVTAGTGVFAVGADVGVLATVAALARALLRSNRFLCKCLKSPSAPSARSQKSWKSSITIRLATIKVWWRAERSLL